MGLNVSDVVDVEEARLARMEDGLLQLLALVLLALLPHKEDDVDGMAGNSDAEILLQ